MPIELMQKEPPSNYPWWRTLFLWLICGAIGTRLYTLIFSPSQSYRHTLHTVSWGLFAAAFLVLLMVRCRRSDKPRPQPRPGR